MRITYTIVYLLIKAFSITPFFILYLISYLFYLIFYYLIPYRKKIIKQNIQRSFPSLDKNEQTKIIKGFYHNLCDILIEAIKGFSISRKSLLKRYKVLNPELMNELFDAGKDIIAVGAHYANWEWGIMASPLQLKHKLYGFYTPLSNKLLDKYMRENREKWGSELVASKDVRKVFNATKDKPTAYFFGADQSPSSPRGAYWLKFLNQDTACMKGPEFFANKYKLPIVYFDIQRIKKGFYTVELKLIIENSEDTVPGEITETYMHTLEQIVLSKPEDYLWSHRRWKHSR